MSNCRGIFLHLVRKFLTLLTKANYHEYTILDKNGKTVGYEYYTPRGSSGIRIMNISDTEDELTLPRDSGHKDKAESCTLDSREANNNHIQENR